VSRLAVEAVREFGDDRGVSAVGPADLLEHFDLTGEVGAACGFPKGRASGWVAAAKLRAACDLEPDRLGNRVDAVGRHAECYSGGAGTLA
jgi:hypothetical protein